MRVSHFSFHAAIGKMTCHSRVFNMGMGIVLIVSNDAAEDVEKWVSGRIPGSQKIGYVVEGAGVHHSPLDLMYTEY